MAAVGWFAILYPNIAAVPLPATIVNAYQGILPTYLYAFQFPVSTVARGADTPLLTPTFGLLTGRHRRDLPGGRLLRVGLEARACRFDRLGQPRAGGLGRRTAWPGRGGA